MLQLENSCMIFPSTITRYTSKITPKSSTALFVSMRRIGVMVYSSFTTFTFSEPFANLEIFSPRQPVHSALLWSSRHPFEFFTRAIHTGRSFAFFCDFYTVVVIAMAAEAKRS
jgi:hypothetical protein